jgi:hypothetical protein
MVAFRDELVAALGGDDGLSPQRRSSWTLTARVALFLDHIDAWLTEQKSLVNHRPLGPPSPALVQRQSLPDHLARLLDRLGLDESPRRSCRFGGVDGGDGRESAQGPPGATNGHAPHPSPHGRACRPREGDPAGCEA